MNTATAFSLPIAIAMGLAAAPSHANGVSVALPAVVIDVNGVLVTVGGPPPPPEVVVVREPAPPPEVIVVREPYYREPYREVYREPYREVVYRDVVVVHEQRPTNIYYVRDGDRGHRCDQKKQHKHKHGHGQASYRR